MSLQSRHMHTHEVPGGGLGLEHHPGGRKEKQSAPRLVVLAASHHQITGRSHRATDLRLRRASSQLGVALIKSQKMWGSQDLRLQPFPLALSDPGLPSFNKRWTLSFSSGQGPDPAWLLTFH